MPAEGADGTSLLMPITDTSGGSGIAGLTMKCSVDGSDAAASMATNQQVTTHCLTLPPPCLPAFLHTHRQTAQMVANNLPNQRWHLRPAGCLGCALPAGFVLG